MTENTTAENLNPKYNRQEELYWHLADAYCNGNSIPTKCNDCQLEGKTNSCETTYNVFDGNNADADNSTENNAKDEDDEEIEGSTKFNYLLKEYSNPQLSAETIMDEPKMHNSSGVMYMNSFAESYNSLLNAQKSTVENELTTTPTPTTICNAATAESNCQNNSNLCMHEILQEQQMYQQQCMSGEDGYLLTKLETRREQQLCGARVAQTFKVFQQLEQYNNEHQLQMHASANINEELCKCSNNRQQPAQGHSETTCQQQLLQQQQHQQQHNILLELTSLLQQECDEEQEVALEVEQQHRHKLQRLQAGAVALAADVSSMPIAASNMNENKVMPVDDETEFLIEEYLDETIQINEISSSSTLPTIMPDNSANCSKAGLTKMLVVGETSKSTPPTLLYEKIEQIEILHEKPELIIETAPQAKLLSTFTTTAVKSQSRQDRLLSKIAKSPYYVPSLPKTRRAPALRTCTAHTRQTQFPNVPNENHSNPREPKSDLRSKRHSFMSQHASTTIAKERRQLRSGNNGQNSRNKSSSIPNVGSGNNLVVDYYSKRTLRTRNSLTKDMKAKTSTTLNKTNSLKRGASVTTHLLRSNRNPVMGVNCGVEAPVKESNVTAHLNTHVINLRSRQVSGSSTHLSTTRSDTASSIMPNVTRNLRSQRSAHTVVATPEITVTNNNYSKSTRLQAKSGVLAAPPPSPKLFRAAVGTRACGMLNKTKIALDTTTVFRRRTLRNAGGTPARTTTPATTNMTTTCAGRVSKRLRR